MASYQLSKPEQILFFFAKVSIDVIKDVFVDILTHFVQPCDLYGKIQSSRMLQNRMISADQFKLCYIKPPRIPDYNEFDVSLLYLLIRNICPIQMPTQGWGKMPRTTDITFGDDIERLRSFRNSFVHGKFTGMPDNELRTIMSNLKHVMVRIQPRECSRYNYAEELSKIDILQFGREDRYMYEKAIFINGPEQVLCGETAHFDAEVEQRKISNWCVTWHKKTGNITTNINTRDEKYKGSTDRWLFIHSVCKDDEAEYLAVISNGDNSCMSNVIYLRAIGEQPYFDNWNITTDTDGLTIHCSYGVPDGSPSIFKVKWTKDGETVDLNNKKIVVIRSSNDRSRLNDSDLTISSPTLEDKGKYSCTVTNAVGSVSRDVTLGVPRAEISTDSEVMFGLKTTITSAVLSCPTPDEVEWQNSNDGKTFRRIDISEPHYYGSSLSPDSPLLVIPYTTFDDMLHYRLLLWNKIGDQCSNTLYLNVTGCPPNIMTNHQTCLKRRTVKLFCEVFPYDPENVFWSINGKEIDNSKSKVKYSEVTIKDPSLTIFNVNEDAAGSYQVTASNAEGSTQSDVIVLAKPQIDFERTEHTDGSLVFMASIDSIPSAYLAQWKVKGKDDETYTPVKGSTEEYKGTSNSLPRPVLVLKQRELLENKCFLIEVDNFVGKSVKEILRKESTEEGKESDSSDKELGRDRGKNILQREAAAKKMLTAEEEKIMDEAKYIILSRPPTAHLFSKGPQNQKEVLPSIVRAEVSKSVGLIHIDGKAKGTGFRVGEKYIVTCEHVIKDAKVTDHIIWIGRVSIEFGRISNSTNRDLSRIFSIISMAYVDKEHDFVVLELGTHDSGVPFPPALTCFGQVCWPDVHLVGHPNCMQMMEDSVIPFWLPEHNNIVIPYIDKLSSWSKIFFPGDNDHYEELRYLKPRKIMFHTTFNHGSSGSPGVMISEEKPCVVLMVRGGVPVCVYENTYPNHTPWVLDNQKVEYGYAMWDIYEKMKNSAQLNVQNLATEIFKIWM